LGGWFTLLDAQSFPLNQCAGDFAAAPFQNTIKRLARNLHSRRRLSAVEIFPVSQPHGLQFIGRQRHLF